MGWELIRTRLLHYSTEDNKLHGPHLSPGVKWTVRLEARFGRCPGAGGASRLGSWQTMAFARHGPHLREKGPALKPRGHQGAKNSKLVRKSTFESSKSGRPRFAPGPISWGHTHDSLPCGPPAVSGRDTQSVVGNRPRCSVPDTPYRRRQRYVCAPSFSFAEKPTRKPGGSGSAKSQRWVWTLPPPPAPPQPGPPISKA